jgi:hypothetical protein
MIRIPIPIEDMALSSDNDVIFKALNIEDIPRPGLFRIDENIGVNSRKLYEKTVLRRNNDVNTKIFLCYYLIIYNRKRNFYFNHQHHQYRLHNLKNNHHRFQKRLFIFFHLISSVHLGFQKYLKLSQNFLMISFKYLLSL